MEVINNQTKPNSYIPFKYSSQSALIKKQEKEVRAGKFLPVSERKLKPPNPVCTAVEEHNKPTFHLTIQYLLDVSSK